MFRKILVNTVSAVGLIIVGAVLFSVRPGSVTKVAQAQSQPDTKTTWKATKLLSLVDESSSFSFPIGPAEWQVTYQKKDASGNFVTSYQETWSLPATPNCYKDVTSCLPGGANAGKFLFGTSALDYVTHVALPNHKPSASTLSFKIIDTAAGGLAGGARITGGDGSRFNAVGAYGWTYFPSTASNETTGTLIPLEWSVQGQFK